MPPKFPEFWYVYFMSSHVTRVSKVKQMEHVKKWGFIQ